MNKQIREEFHKLRNKFKLPYYIEKEAKIRKHQNGKRKTIGWIYLGVERFSTEQEAIQRLKELKSSSGNSKKDAEASVKSKFLDGQTVLEDGQLYIYEGDKKVKVKGNSMTKYLVNKIGVKSESPQTEVVTKDGKAVVQALKKRKVRINKKGEWCYWFDEEFKSYPNAQKMLEEEVNLRVQKQRQKTLKTVEEKLEKEFGDVYLYSELIKPYLQKLKEMKE